MVKIIISGLLLATFLNTTIAQNTTFIEAVSIDTNYIQWVGQFPGCNADTGKVRFFKKLNELLFGKKSPELTKPISLIAESPETFWVLDQGKRTVLSVHKNVGEIPHFFNKKNMDFPSLVGICEISHGEILFTDSYLNKIFHLSTDRKKLIAINDTLRLEKPTGIAYNKITNQIWVTDTDAHCILVLNEKGEIIKVIGKRGINPGEFNFPTFIWIDRFGIIYVVDAMNFRVQIFNKEGEFLSLFGEIGDATGYLSRPKGIATDSYGNIYLVDALFHAVQIFDKSGKFLYKFGGQGHENGQFWLPVGIYIDDKDFIYIADSYNSRIQIFKLINRDVNEGPGKH
jgi:DNA-binding beta-propeller fold protein YncE